VNCNRAQGGTREKVCLQRFATPAQRWTIAKKKTLIASEQDRPTSPKTNPVACFAGANRSRQVVFTTKRGQNQHDARYRARRGHAFGGKNSRTWQTTTFFGRLRAEGFIAPLPSKAPSNGGCSCLVERICARLETWHSW